MTGNKSQKNASNTTKQAQKFHSSNKSRTKKVSSDKSTKILCKECHAVYDGKSWKAFEKSNPRVLDRLHVGICPACHEEIDHLSDGVLHLSGTGFVKNKSEIKNLIKNTAKREEERDILNRVERIEDLRNEMVVYTTKNQLAAELGKKIAAAHKGGKLEIKWSKNDKPVEVKWLFDLKK